MQYDKNIEANENKSACKILDDAVTQQIQRSGLVREKLTFMLQAERLVTKLVLDFLRFHVGFSDL